MAQCCPMATLFHVNHGFCLKYSP